MTAWPEGMGAIQRKQGLAAGRRRKERGSQEEMGARVQGHTQKMRPGT